MAMKPAVSTPSLMVLPPRQEFKLSLDLLRFFAPYLDRRLPMTETRHSPAYDRIEALLAGDQCVVLDGGVGSEITRRLTGGSSIAQGPGIWEIYEHTGLVRDVHRD